MTKAQNRELGNNTHGYMRQRRNFWSDEKEQTGSEIELGQLATYGRKIIFDPLAHQPQKKKIPEALETQKWKVKL